jgi:hypothetical protein
MFFWKRADDMSESVIIRGRYANQHFRPDEPLPRVEGTAELVDHASSNGPQVSIFDLFGKAPSLRSREDIEEQPRQDRDEWGRW